MTLLFVFGIINDKDDDRQFLRKAAVNQRKEKKKEKNFYSRERR